MLDGRHHRRAGGARLRPVDHANRAIQHTRHDPPQRQRPRGPAAEADLVRNRSHRRITVARGERESFVDGAHQIVVADIVVEPGEGGAGPAVDEGTAFARRRDVGVVQRRRGPGLEDAFVETVEQRPGIGVDAAGGQDVASDAQYPVDVQGGGHVGLKLDEPAAGERDRVAAGLIGERDRLRGPGVAHVDAGRAGQRHRRRGAGVVEAAAERGAHHVHESQGDGQIVRQTGRPGDRVEQRMRVAASIDDGRQQVRAAFESECPQHLGRILPAAEAAEAEQRLAGVGRPMAGEARVQVVLAVIRGRGGVQQLRLMPLHPQHLGAHLACVEDGAGGGEDGGVAGAALELGHDVGGPRIQPQPAVVKRLVVLVDQPRAVPLGGHRGRPDSIAIRAQLGDQLAQCVDQSVPSVREALHRGAVRGGVVAIRA